MAPFTAWLPVVIPSPVDPDLVIKIIGRDVADIASGLATLEYALADQGYAVFSQAPVRMGENEEVSARLRVTAKPVSSLGNGYDVIVSLDGHLPETVRLELQQGSVLVCEETAAGHLTERAIPSGVIVYPTPFLDLNRRHGASTLARGLIAAGVLTHLLGLDAACVRRWIQPEDRAHYFDAGLGFASSRLVKRDIHSLSALPGSQPRMLFNAEQAVALGLTMGACPCDERCLTRFDHGPSEWVDRHLQFAWRSLSSKPALGRSGGTVMQCASGITSVVLGCTDPAGLARTQISSGAMVAVAGDVMSAMSLARAGRDRSQVKSGKVIILVDETLVHRHETVDLLRLARLVSLTHESTERPGCSAALEQQPLAPEWDMATGASVGFIAWGSAQGVVREAVALCRRFGIQVAALYPKLLWPAPVGELEHFASAVRHVAVVEPNREGRYTQFVQDYTEIVPRTIEPDAGQPLTPMDIFMKEHLGVDLLGA